MTIAGSNPKLTGPLPTQFLNVRTLPKRGVTVKLKPDTGEKSEIAMANDLNAVSQFDAECLVMPWGKKGVEISGRIQAAVVQPCAVSGEPLEASVDELIKAVYLPENSELRKPVDTESGEIVIDFESDDAPEYFLGDEIDLYEVVLEFFVLGLNPFLRRDDAETLPETEDPSGREDSPFSILKSLKNS